MSNDLNGLMFRYFKGQYNVDSNSESVSLDTLYECGGNNFVTGQSIYIYPSNSTVDIYVSNSSTQPAAKANMILTSSDTNIGGLQRLDIIPKWIFIEQNTGTTSEIIINGVELTSKGGF